MRTDVDSATQNALLNAFEKGLSVRQLVWLTGKDRTTGAAVTAGFWNGLDTETISVIDAVTGETVARDYTGGGALPGPDSVGDIPLVMGLDVQAVSITFSAIHPGVETAARQYDLRQGTIQVHRAILDPVSGLRIGTPQLHFYGRINTAPFDDGSAGGEATLILGCTDIINELTRTNPMRRSVAQSTRRNDAIYRYSGVAASWNIWWGAKATNP